MSRGKPTPDYKFRLLCKRCNSYLNTSINVIVADNYVKLALTCTRCGTRASDLNEEKRG